MAMSPGAAASAHVGEAVGEVCFNTAMTGYQEVMTDPSYAAQIVTFTFPHIGNVGVNDEDLEIAVEGAVGCVVREDVTAAVQLPRARRLRRVAGGATARSAWPGIDTRALTRRIRAARRAQRGDRARSRWRVRHSPR